MIPSEESGAESIESSNASESAGSHGNGSMAERPEAASLDVTSPPASRGSESSMSERAEESAAAHGVAPGQQVGLGLPRWTGWAGSACFIAAIVLTVFTIIRTVRLVAGWEALDHPHAGLVGVIIRWAVVTVLFLLGWLLTTANSRARAKAAAATLRDLT